MRERGVILVIVLSVLILIGVIWRFSLEKQLKPVTTPTLNLTNGTPAATQIVEPFQGINDFGQAPPTKIKIYENKEYRFGIDYPEMYSFDEKSWAIRFSENSVLYFYISSYLNFNVETYFPLANKELKLLLDKDPDCFISLNYEDITNPSIRKHFDIRQECSDLFNSKELGEKIIIEAAYNKEYVEYGFIFQSTKNEFEKFISPVTKIIQSFRILLPEEGSLDISNWQTFENKEFSFSLKYPPHLIKVKEVIIEDEFGQEGKVKAIEFSSKVSKIYPSNGRGELDKKDEKERVVPVLNFFIYKIPKPIFDLISEGEEVSKLNGKEVVFGLIGAGVNYTKKIRIQNEDLIGVIRENLYWGVGEIVFLLFTPKNETLVIKYQAVGEDTDDPYELLRIHLNNLLLPKVGIRKNEITMNNEHFFFAQILSTFKFIE